jgi:hypothetical protein
MTGTTHRLKVWPLEFAALEDGSKPFEWRLNDRDYQVGDTLDLHELHAPFAEKTGRTTTRVMTYVLKDGFGVPPGYAVLGLKAEATPAPTHSVMGSPADQIIGQIEELFPNWRSYRDLVDCITCELHELRKRAEGQQ